MELLIKNMVSIRCMMIVKSELKKLGFNCKVVELGKVETKEIITKPQIEKIKNSLHPYGLELMENRKNILVEKIKNVVIDRVHYSNDQLKINFSTYLSAQLNYDYTYLANLFSESQKITLEYFIILHKIEKVKELISYDELSLTQISYKLHYSSVAHLSSQFKKVTSLTPSQFKHLQQKQLCCLENV